MVSKDRWAIAGVGLLVVATALAGCGPAPAFGVTMEEAAGVWGIDHEEGSAVLTLHEDGTLEYSNWPDNLLCKYIPANKTAAIHWDELVSGTGEWSAENEDGGDQIFLAMERPCMTAAFAWVDRVGSTLQMRFPLGSLEDIYNDRLSVAFEQQPPDSSAAP